MAMQYTNSAAMRKPSSFTTMVTSFLLLLFALLLDSSSATARGGPGARLLLNLDEYESPRCGKYHHNQRCEKPLPCCAKANGTCTDNICFLPDCDPDYGDCFPPHSPPPPPHSPPPPPHSPPPPPHSPPPPPHSPPPGPLDCGEKAGRCEDTNHPCCGSAGLCGYEELYCDIGHGCQPEYGECWPSPTLHANNLIRGFM